MCCVSKIFEKLILKRIQELEIESLLTESKIGSELPGKMEENQAETRSLDDYEESITGEVIIKTEKKEEAVCKEAEDETAMIEEQGTEEAETNVEKIVEREDQIEVEQGGIDQADGKNIQQIENKSPETDNPASPAAEEKADITRIEIQAPVDTEETITKESISKTETEE